jgi:hypothetical protein
MANLIEYFRDLPDPRLERKKEHDLTELIHIAIAAVICGADDWNAVERLEQLKQDCENAFLKIMAVLSDGFLRLLG